MRNQDEVIEFENSIKGKKFSDEKKYFYVSAFEGCIPFKFWDVQKKQIDHNKQVFKKIILKYCKNVNTALQKGYGLVLIGKFNRRLVFLRGTPSCLEASLKTSSGPRHD